MCKNMESENSHLCQHTPAQCMHSHLCTQTRSLSTLFRCHEVLCEDSGITLCTSSAIEKLAGKQSVKQRNIRN